MRSSRPVALIATMKLWNKNFVGKISGYSLISQSNRLWHSNPKSGRFNPLPSSAAARSGGPRHRYWLMINPKDGLMVIEDGIMQSCHIASWCDARVRASYLLKVVRAPRRLLWFCFCFVQRQCQFVIHHVTNTHRKRNRKKCVNKKKRETRIRFKWCAERESLESERQIPNSQSVCVKLATALSSAMIAIIEPILIDAHENIIPSCHHDRCWMLS